MKPQYLLILEVSGQIFDKVVTCKINSSDIYDVEKPISFKKTKTRKCNTERREIFNLAN